MDELISAISRDLVLPSAEVEAAYRHAGSRCRHLKIEQRGKKGFRLVSQPAAPLKPILSWLNLQVISKLEISSIATAFHNGSSTLSNAQRHRNSLYSVRIDIKDFFPSIRHTDLYRTISDQKSKLPDWVLKPEAMRFIGHVCFDESNRLPIGYSTSPAIANAVMLRLDEDIRQMISNNNKFGECHITRYADDFLFSTDQKGACKTFAAEFEALLKKSKSPALQINQEKTRFMSRAGGSTLITGLRINNSGGVVVHPDYRDHVRLLLNLYKSNRLQAEDIPRLVGHLAYVQHVDPGLFTKLSFKFDQEITRLRKLGANG